MAEVELVIGGRHYQLACADGEEQSLRTLGIMVDEQIQSARLMAGGLTEARQLLFAAILLADRLVTAENGDNNGANSTSTVPTGEIANAPSDAAITRLVDRIDGLTLRLQSLV